MPRMLRDILSALIVSQPDMTIVGEIGDVDDADALAGTVGSARPDVVIVGLEQGEPPAVCTQLLSRFPQVKIIAVEARGRSAALWELRPYRTLIGEVSAQALADTIRAATGPDAFAVHTVDSAERPG